MPGEQELPGFHRLSSASTAYFRWCVVDQPEQAFNIQRNETVQNLQAIRTVGEDELSQVRGGLFGWVKKAAKWVKDHVVGGAYWIGYKGKF